MARPHSVYACGECGARHAQWHGRCPECGSWSSLTQESPAGGGSHPRDLL
ncbi:MAG: DNA repair protein RadA, partial [Myxococcota bacterium]